MEWIAVIDKLPPLNKYVLCLHARFTWIDKDDPYKVNAIVLKRIEAKEEGNNKRPYSYNEFGPDSFFGQDILYWAEIPEIPEVFVRLQDITKKKREEDFKKILKSITE